MTREETLALPAGPELDRLVAEKVMGWELIDRVAAGWGKGPPVWRTGEDPDDINSGPTYQGFAPSSDIAQAWLVVEKLTGGMIQFRLEKTMSGRIYAKFVDCHKPVHVVGGASADAAPLAICRAALLTAFALENSHAS